MPQITTSDVDLFRNEVVRLAGESSNNIIGWLYNLVPHHGMYAGNGSNDALIIFQAYNNIFGDGTLIPSTSEGASIIQRLFNNYRSENPSDPLNIWPREPSDWNAFFHDIGSLGGLSSDIANHLTYAQREITDFLNGADIFHLVSGPFIGIFGTASSLVNSAIDAAGTVIGFGMSQMSQFFNSVHSAFNSLSFSSFSGAIGSFLSDVGNVWNRLQEVVGEMANRITPVVVDLDGDGVELIAMADSLVVLDVNGDGVLDRMGWIGADDGLIAFDANGDGVVNGISEYSFSDPANGIETDLEGLARRDTNGDGRLSAADADFDRFLVWQDADGDGDCDAGEVRSLTEAGIASIDLMLNGQSGTRAGNTVYNTSSWTDAAGARHEVLDVGLVAAWHQLQTRVFDWGQITAGADGFDVQTRGGLDLSAMWETAAESLMSGHNSDWLIA